MIAYLFHDFLYVIEQTIPHEIYFAGREVSRFW